MSFISNTLNINIEKITRTKSKERTKKIPSFNSQKNVVPLSKTVLSHTILTAFLNEKIIKYLICNLIQFYPKLQKNK